MDIHIPQGADEIKIIIADFLKKRLDDKLEKVPDDEPKRTEFQQQFVPGVWLEDAARRVKQIQAVTHSLKPVHPDAKGSSLYSPSQARADLQVVGSHCLKDDFEIDVVGNAAALDVYKFLKLEHQGRSLLSLALARDPDLAAALSDDAALAEEWINAFAGLVEPRGKAASHTLAKQLYWPTGDPHDDDGFHLLSPLYATSLAHRVYRAVQDDRFSEEATAARQARKDGEYSARAVREYPQLALQKLGGTKPQNISQLNSERRGDNLLFASLPPVWQSSEVRPLWGTDSMFSRFGRRSDVRNTLKSLIAFLRTDPASNVETRRRRAAWIDALIDAFLQFSAELQSLPPGWTDAPECHLTKPEKHWLDPEGVEQALASDGLPRPTDSAERVSALFSNWLNAQLRDYLPVGDPEYLEWRKQVFEHIKAYEREGRHDD